MGAVHRSAVALACAFAFALIGAASAHAATFCVQDAACEASGGTGKPTLQAAFDAATAIGINTKSTVKVGATPTPIPPEDSTVAFESR